jgi:hypothetical protein
MRTRRRTVFRHAPVWDQPVPYPRGSSTERRLADAKRLSAVGPSPPRPQPYETSEPLPVVSDPCHHMPWGRLPLIV